MVAADDRTAVTFSLSPGQCGDAPEGRKLLESLAGCGWEGACAVMDRAYEGNETRQLVFDLGMDPVVPPKCNVLVDEYQDTKEIQYSIIASILRAGQGGSRLFMVGDPNQAIYTSLGGYPITVQDLEKLTTLTIKTLSLSANYRSSMRIVDYFSNFSVNNSIVIAEGKHRDYASKITYDNQINRDQLINEIAKVVQYSVGTLGISPKEICILAPQWVHLAVMTRGLIAHMPNYQFDGPGIVPIARDIDNFWYKLSRIALTEPSPQLFIRRMRWAREILHDLTDAGVDTSTLNPRHFLRQCNSLSIQEKDGLSYLKIFFESLFSTLKIPFHVFDSLEEQYQAFIAGTESRIERILKEGVTQIRDLSFFKKLLLVDPV